MTTHIRFYLTAILVSACGSLADVDRVGVDDAKERRFEATADVFFPLAVGNTWTLSSYRETRTVTIREVSSDGFYAVDDLFPERMWLQASETAIMLRLDDAQPGEEPTPFLRTDVAADATWRVRVGHGACDVWDGQMLEDNAEIAAEEGVFSHALVFQFTPATVDGVRCPAPSVWGIAIAPSAGVVELTSAFGSPPMRLESHTVAR